MSLMFCVNFCNPNKTYFTEEGGNISAAVSPIDWQPGMPMAASERWPMGDGMETELF